MVTPPRPVALGLLLAMLATLGSGCAAGYIAVRPRPAPGAEGDRADWSGLTFVVPATAPGERWAATRALRLRHGALDVRTGTPPPGAFLLTIERKRDENGAPILMAASYLTFAVLPGWYDERTGYRFTLAAPDGAILEGRGETGSLAVSWLPFLLLGPTLVGVGSSGTDDLAIDGLDAFEEELARFLASAAPFVAAHEGRRGVVP